MKLPSTLILPMLLHLVMLADPTSTTAPENKNPRIAIVGAGIGGASTASFLTRLFEDNGYNVTIDVYEKLHVGGRLATSELDGRLYETGGSAIHHKNKYMQQFAKELGLSKRHVFGIRLGLFDGKQYIVTESDRTLSSFGKSFHRYGDAISNWHQVIDEIWEMFLRIYEIQDAGYAFTSVERLLDAIDPMLVNLTKTSTRDYLTNKGILPMFINEMVMGIIRLVYGQTPDINALVGTLSLAGAKAGLWGVRGGNEQVPQLLIKRSSANLVIRKVTRIILKPDGTFGVVSKGVKGPMWRPSIRNIAMTRHEQISNLTQDQRHELYDMVVLATPLVQDVSGINFEGFPFMSNYFEYPNSLLSSSASGSYHRSVTTLVNGKLNTDYLKAERRDSLLDEILTIDDKSIFNSLNRVYPVDLDEEVNQMAGIWKVSSKKPLTEAELDAMFTDRRANASTHWFAYPRYADGSSHQTASSDHPFLLHPGMFHTSSIDWAATSMEMSAISGRNVGLLALYHWTKKSEIVDSFRDTRHTGTGAHRPTYRDEF